MLKICTEQEYRKYAYFVYELALDQSKSGYPTYSDGIKTKEMFLERSQKAFSRDTENILLFELQKSFLMVDFVSQNIGRIYRKIGYRFVYYCQKV